MTFRLPVTLSERWQTAIERWVAGDASSLERALLRDEPIPEFARLWLIEALAGRVKRRRGRKRAASLAALLDRHLREWDVLEVFDRHIAVETGRSDIGGTPTERALAATAVQCSMSEDAVSHIVFKRRK